MSVTTSIRESAVLHDRKDLTDPHSSLVKTMRCTFWYLGTLTSLILFAGQACSSKEDGRDGREARQGSPQRTAEAEHVELIGSWTIVDYAAPGVVALSEHEIRTRQGRRVRFSRDIVVYGEHRCISPDYTDRIVQADSFFRAEYLTTPDSAKVRPTAQDQLRITEIRCSGETWNAPPQEVLWSGADSILFLEGGVFFILRREDGAG